MGKVNLKQKIHDAEFFLRDLEKQPAVQGHKDALKSQDELTRKYKVIKTLVEEKNLLKTKLKDIQNKIDQQSISFSESLKKIKKESKKAFGKKSRKDNKKNKRKEEQKKNDN